MADSVDEIAVEQQPQGMKLRPRRSALSDISNTIAQQFSSVFSKKPAAKKRKSTSADEVVDLTQPLPVPVPVHDDASSTMTVDKVEVTETMNVVHHDVILQEIHQSQHAVEAIAMVTNPAYEMPTLKKARTGSEQGYGFAMPLKLKRRIPLQTQASDPAQCFDILDDIYAFFHFNQTSSIRRPIHQQSEITAKMRTILIDWILEVHFKYRLQPPTLWLTVHILDTYLSKEPILRNKIQLVGITALFVACKFEEFNAPEVKDMVYLTDNAYQKQELLQMETSILQSLDYQLMVPTGHHFLIRLLNRIGASERLRLIAFYTAERNLQENDNVNVLPQVYACAALFVALCTVRFENGLADAVTPTLWTAALQEESMGKQVRDFYDLSKLMALRNNELPAAGTRRKLEAAKKKYSTKTTQHISSIVFPTFP